MLGAYTGGLAMPARNKNAIAPAQLYITAHPGKTLFCSKGLAAMSPVAMADGGGASPGAVVLGCEGGLVVVRDD